VHMWWCILFHVLHGCYVFVLYYYFILLHAVIAVLFDDYSSARQYA
jgi:hypothetical protein